MTTTFFTAANELYEPFVMPYAVSVLHHNSEALVEVCVTDPQSFKDRNSECLSVLRKYFPDRFHFRGGRYGRFRPAFLRFIEEPELRSEFTYIGDIDILILESDVVQQHLQNMTRTGLPYSNRLRPPAPGKLPMLTGLHFTRTDAHYPLFDFDDWSMPRRDEELLHQIVEAKGLQIIDQSETFRPIHGIHMSVKRTPTRAPNAGPPWQLYSRHIDPYLALWQVDSWLEAARCFHPAYRMLLLVMESAIQATNAELSVYRRREATALWATLVTGDESSSSSLSLSDPRSNSPVNQSGGDFKQQKRPRQSVNLLQTQLEPPKVAASQNAERARLIADRFFEEAIELQSKRLAEYPTDPQLHNQMSYNFRTVGNTSKALAHILEACRLAPTVANYRRTASRLLTLQGDLSEAGRMNNEANELERQAELAFHCAQQQAKVEYARRLDGLINRHLNAWPHMLAQSSGIPIANNLFEIHSVDTVPKWRSYVRPKFGLGDEAEVEQIGRFRITSLQDTVQKRLACALPWELPIVALLLEIAVRCKPTSVLVEVGANIGTHTVPMCRTFEGMVIAYEPVASNVNRLKDHLLMNHIENCLIVEKACSSACGQGSMTIFNEEDGGRARLDLTSNGTTSVTTLDNEALPGPVALLKIDVEGHELETLRGAKKLLLQDRPIVVCEILGSTDSIVSMMSGVGFTGARYFRSDWVFYPDQ